jgi:predicted aspartyl protease
MAAEILVPVNEGNEYWVDILVNDVAVAVQIDTGLTQASCEIGVALRSTDFDRLLSSFGQRSLSGLEIATGPVTEFIPTATARVSIDDLDDSEIETQIVRLESNLLGVCFFHRLPGFEVHWDLASRAMTIRRIA